MPRLVTWAALTTLFWWYGPYLTIVPTTVIYYPAQTCVTTEANPCAASF